MAQLPESIAALLLPPQIPHVNHLLGCLDVRTVIVDGSDPGTGKTYVYAALCAAAGIRPLICSPKPNIPTIYAVLESFGVEPLGIVNYETLKNGKFYDSLDAFYHDERVDCPYLTITRVPMRSHTGSLVLTKGGQPRMQVKRIKWQLPDNSITIFDEAHRGKNGLNSGSTLNSELMVSIRACLNRNRRCYGMLVSGTLTDKPENFDVAGYILGLYQPHVRQVYDQFLTRVSRANAGNLMLGFHKLLYPDYGSRMTIREIKATTGNTIFKENHIKAKAYTIDRATAMRIEYYNQQIQQTLAEIRSKVLTRGFGYIIRCWQKIEMLKTPKACQVIRKRYLRGQSIVVFTCFKRTKKQIFEGISDIVPMDEIGYIDGDQDAVERESIVKQFRADTLRVLVCQIIAGGEALSFHDTRGVHQRFTLCFPTWSAICIKQALGRTYRANAKSDSEQVIFYIKPANSGFGDEAEPGLDLVAFDVALDEPDFDEIAQLEDLSSVDPSLQKLVEVASLEQAHLTVEEKICMCVSVKLDNIDVINDGVLTGHSIFLKPVS